MMNRISAAELAAIRERRIQARANSAIEGVTLTLAHEALFAEFDAEGVPHDERRRRLILRLTATPLVPAE